MRTVTRLAGGAGALLGLGVWLAPAAGAAPAASGGPAAGAVFVQTDNLAGNHVVAYDRAATGQLTPAGSYATHGLGGALHGSVVDHLASQGSLAYDAADSLLIAVNAGSNTISVFSVQGDRLCLRQVIPSGGTFPVSVAARGDLVYVLDAKNGGAIQGYTVHHGRLSFLSGSHRNLGLTIPSDTTQFTHTPGQVAWSPDGRHLIVTTKATTNAIDVFGVDAGGRPSAAPAVDVEAGAVPFAVTFDPGGRLVVAEAGPSAVATFTLGSAGGLTPVGSVATAQAATCWIAGARGYFYASNAGSATESGLADAAGQLSLLGATPTDPGTVDAAATPGGQFLYVQTGGTGAVDGYRVGASGGLSAVGSVTVPGAVGGEGIVAT